MSYDWLNPDGGAGDGLAVTLLQKRDSGYGVAEGRTTRKDK